MAPLKVEQYVVGPVQTNCYFAVNDETKEMILIDPGANADRLIQIIEEEKLNPVAILLTHGHFDHAGGAAEVAAHFGIKVYAEEHERETLDDPKLNLSGWTGAETTYHADVFLKDPGIVYTGTHGGWLLLLFCLSGRPFFRGYAVRPVGRKDGFSEGERFGADSRHQGEVTAASG